MEKRKYYDFAIDEDQDTADLYIFGDITSWPWKDSDKSSSEIVAELQALTVKNITVHINSYGGEVAEGLAIYNTLKNSDKNVTTICDGFACSAASVVFMAGSKRLMNKASLLMVHNAWSIAQGNADDLEKAAKDLRTISEACKAAYLEQATISDKEMQKLMDKETWITPDDAVSYGLATEVVEPEEDDSKASDSAFQAIFNKLTAPTDEENITTPIDVEALKAWLQAAVHTAASAPAASTPEQTPAAAPEEPAEPELTGWNKFFNSKRG